MITDYFFPGFTIERNTQTKDNSLGMSDSWAQLSTPNGAIRSLSGNEISFNNSRQVESSHKVYFPAGTDITEKDRVLHQGNIYDVTFVDPKRNSQAEVSHLEVTLLLRK